MRLHWFESALLPSTVQPLYRSPSSAEETDCKVSEPALIGTPVAIAKGFDSATVGTAIHATIAAGIGESGPLSADQTADLLRRHGVAGAVDAGQLREFVIALKSWIASTWPEAEIHSELPVMAPMASGQIARGQIDLLVEGVRERVILDFKTGPEKAAADSQLIRHYAGQLSAYVEVANSLRRLPVARRMLVLTAAGASVELIDR